MDAFKKRLIDKHVVFVKTLGQGSFGKVNLYKNIKNQYFTVKHIKLKKKTSIKEFEKELFIMRNKLGCSTFILCPLDDTYFTYVDSDYAHLAMEYLSEGSLQDYVMKNKISINDFKKLKSQLVEGLLFIHSKKIAHMDIKPDNIMVTKRKSQKGYKIKYIDFGLSCLTESCNNGGTPLYMSPNQFQGHKQITFAEAKKADVWALGIVLNQLYTISHGYKLPGVYPEKKYLWFNVNTDMVNLYNKKINSLDKIKELSILFNRTHL